MAAFRNVTMRQDGGGARRIAVPLLAALCVAPVARGESVELSAAADCTLYQDFFGFFANGAGGHLFTGENGSGLIRRSLLRFDVAAALPADAIVESVVLRLHMSKTIAPPQMHTLHRVLQAWGEGPTDPPGEEGVGAGSQPGDATWLHTFYPGQLWSTPGGDFDPAVSAAGLVGDIEFYEWSSTALAADVQQWLHAPGGNFGWMLRGNEILDTTAKRFDSSEHVDPARRPVLTIHYTIVPAPMTLAAAGIAACGRRRRR
jgi:hypothetical protein